VVVYKVQLNTCLAVEADQTGSGKRDSVDMERWISVTKTPSASIEHSFFIFRVGTTVRMLL
jgi:hypothetical protein